MCEKKRFNLFLKKKLFFFSYKKNKKETKRTKRMAKGQQFPLLL